MPNLFIRQAAAYLLLVLSLMVSLTAHAGKPKHPKPDCKACNLNGPTTGYVGQAGMFVLTTGTLGTSTNRKANGDTWMKSLNEISYPVPGQTPFNAPGMTIFEKGKEPFSPETQANAQGLK